jgi:hypothetical protein
MIKITVLCFKADLMKWNGEFVGLYKGHCNRFTISSKNPSIVTNLIKSVTLDGFARS